jgi:regulator of protease activity HflC (stomatin/prohibitin superfamily)
MDGWLFLNFLTSAGLMFLGAGAIGAYFLLFKVPEGSGAITRWRPGKVYKPGWNFGLPVGAQLINVQRSITASPLRNYLTPDNGLLGIAVSVTWGYDPSNPTAPSLSQLETMLRDRMNGVLNQWIRARPYPGTLKRALASQAEAEQAIFNKLTTATSEALALRNDPSTAAFGCPAPDLGIIIYEVNITDVQVERRGTDKPDWGDDSYSMPAILHGFINNVANLDELARLHARLLREYPNQVDAIERFYDQERIRIMERKR